MTDADKFVCKDCSDAERKKHVESLLEDLKKEREKYPDQDEEKMLLMIQALIILGEYPAQTVLANPNTVRQMVAGYGAYWHRWPEPLSCPHCNADLRNHKLGPPFKREVQKTNTSSATPPRCPDCEGGIE